ncbi:hypothetical protein PGT21_025777 [Puccinia graminis f. sp. tritici]|uniref:Fungal-type protein kinase domain-containing protein n=1 Tax=Puccinia graminis f. sp. tritici TaxID=56615 RepID=A0A5B0NM91_PUCGR|nr:hypothetical protein PGT21_025777 [Puccinia graminis f. sp. tritici]
MKHSHYSQESSIDKYPADSLALRLAAPVTRLLEDSLTTTSTSVSTPSLTDGTRQLNCAIVSRSSDDSTHTRDILVPVELKKTRAEARDADLLLAKQASKIFTTQPTRIYVVGLTLCGSSVRLWQFLIGLVPLALSSSRS